MLFTRRKAETEILSSTPHSPDRPHPLVRYLGYKIQEGILALAQVPKPGLLTNDGKDQDLFDDF
jgi:hypothetical protein